VATWLGSSRRTCELAWGNCAIVWWVCYWRS